MRRAVAVALAILGLGAAVYLEGVHLATHGSKTGIADGATACLRSHGWSLGRASSAYFLATRGPYSLTYHAGIRAFRWRPGWTHAELTAKAAQTAFACFPTFRIRL